jgi:UDP-N-acetylmuramoyl-L-alanyl-D-glutamate--2,6-diaminopimelate ligase
MKLSCLLEGIAAQSKHYNPLLEISGIAYDSRKVKPGDCFVAWQGQRSDGHYFVNEAIAKGAVALLCERWLPDDFPQIKVSDSRRMMATLAARLYNTAERKIKKVCVTGTNGKTTTTYLFRAFGEAAGVETAAIGTLGVIGNIDIAAGALTTPESADLHRTIATLDEAGVKGLILEGSSIAQCQGRLDELVFDAVGFTNLTQDHLDFHGTMEAYYQAKKEILQNREKGAAAIINADDPFGQRLLKELNEPLFAISVKSSIGDYHFQNLALHNNGISALIHTPTGECEIGIPLLGEYNAANLLLAAALYHQLELPFPEYVRAEHFKAAPGRMESIATAKGTAVIDFAHTPDAIKQICKTLRDLTPQGKLITVMGAGGDRDDSKRPKMAKNAGQYSDMIILTNDNPRTEDPQKIISDLKSGLDSYSGKVYEIADRQEAITFALEKSKPGDIVAILGKGAESYQEIQNVKFPYRDQDVVLGWNKKYED